MSRHLCDEIFIALYCEIEFSLCNPMGLRILRKDSSYHSNREIHGQGNLAVMEILVLPRLQFPGNLVPVTAIWCAIGVIHYIR